MATDCYPLHLAWLPPPPALTPWWSSPCQPAFPAPSYIDLPPLTALHTSTIPAWSPPALHLPPFSISSTRSSDSSSPCVPSLKSPSAACQQSLSSCVAVRHHASTSASNQINLTKRRPSKSGKSRSLPTNKSHTTTSQNFKCNSCQETFKTLRSLKLHCRTQKHDPSPPHDTPPSTSPVTCSICDKTFATVTTLRIHKRQHSGHKPYQCEECDKSFSDNSVYTRHKRIHSRERPYKCSVCFLDFSQAGNLRRHFNTYH